MTSNNTTHKKDESETEASLPQQIRELQAEVSTLGKAGTEALTDTLARWLTAHYVAAAKSAARKAGTKGMDLKTLRGLIADVVGLRRGDHSAERLSIEREQLQLNRQLSKERVEKLSLEWAIHPENKSIICDSGLSAEKEVRRLQEIFHRRERPRAEEPRCDISRETIRMIQEKAGLL